MYIKVYGSDALGHIYDLFRHDDGIHKTDEQYLIKNYNVTQSGARVLDRIIDTEIKQHIADAILFGKLKNGGLVDIDYSKKLDKIVFKFKGINKKNYKELEPS